MSNNVKRGFEVALTIAWLGGTALLLEAVDAGWRWFGVLAVLVVVGAAEVVFIRWNEGHWPGASTST